MPIHTHTHMHMHTYYICWQYQGDIDGLHLESQVSPHTHSGVCGEREREREREDLRLQMQAIYENEIKALLLLSAEGLKRLI